MTVASEAAAAGGQRYALLLAMDDFPEYVGEARGGYFGVFAAAFGDAGERWDAFRVYDGEFPTPDEVAVYDGFVVTGSPSDAHGDEPWVLRLCDFLRTLHAMEKRLLGVCFGHQVMANDEQPEHVAQERALDDEEFIIEEIEDDSTDPVVEEELQLVEPMKGMIFDSIDDAFRFYKRYARIKGFAITKRSSRTCEDKETVQYFTLACSRQGKSQSSSKNAFKPNPSARMDCPAKLNFALHGPENKYRLSSLTHDHNHDLSPGKARFLRCHKQLDLAAKRRLQLNDRAGIRVNKYFNSLVVQAGGYENLEFGEKECRNYLQEERRLRLGAGDANAIYQYFLRMQSKNSNFFYIMDLDTEGRLKNVFWADARSRAAYESFSDVVTFDTTYLTNKYDMPFAPFVGVNHHGESILLGCALLSNEETKTCLAPNWYMLF